MASRYRPQSPPSYGRRVVPSERASAGALPTSNYSDYGRDRREPYHSPKSSNERVIPVGTETYRNGSLVSSSRPSTNYDIYDDRRPSVLGSEASSRRSTATSSTNPSSVSASTATASRAPPAVIHQNLDRHSTSSGRPLARHDRGGDYYITPSSSTSYREQPGHKKKYSAEDEKRAVAIGSREREDDSHDRDRLRREPTYHLRGPSSRYNPVDDDSTYEYVGPREVFENTEPKWRPARRGSVDAHNRERPSSLVETQDRPVRNAARDAGPPPATRALEKLNNEGAIYRQSSLRDPVRSPPRNRDRGRERGSFSYNSEDEDYPVTPRVRRPRHDSASYSREPPYSPTRAADYTERRESLRPSRRYEDVDVANRGFGIRASSIEPPRSSDPAVDSKTRYAAEPSPIPPDFTLHSHRHDDRRRDRDERYHDHDTNYDNEAPAGRETDVSRRADRHSADRDRNRDHQLPPNDTKSRPQHYPPEGYHRSRYIPQEVRSNRDTDVSKGRDKAPDERKSTETSKLAATVPVAAAGTVALAAAAESISRKSEPEEQQQQGPSPIETQEKAPNSRSERREISPDDPTPRQRHYVSKDESREELPISPSEAPKSSIDPDEEYRLRVQQEANRAKQSSASDARPNKTRRDARSTRDPDDLEADSDGAIDPLDKGDSRALAIREDTAENVLNEPLTEEPAEVVEHRENRVRIVEPPKEKDQPKSILRKPTTKFPEDPNPVREGVAPLKGESRDIPEGTKWTKIPRQMVNPQALEEAGERFEERKDFVIVLRPITREQVQTLADRTEAIRREREKHYHHHRDRRHRRDDVRRRDDDNDSEDDSNDARRT